MKAKLPKEDPRLKAQRERAETVAEQQTISETQRRLEDETASFAARFGSRAAVGGLTKSFGARQANRQPVSVAGFGSGFRF